MSKPNATVTKLPVSKLRKKRPSLTERYEALQGEKARIAGELADAHQALADLAEPQRRRLAEWDIRIRNGMSFGLPIADASLGWGASGMAFDASPIMVGLLGYQMPLWLVPAFATVCVLLTTVPHVCLGLQRSMHIAKLWAALLGLALGCGMVTCEWMYHAGSHSWAWALGGATCLVATMVLNWRGFQPKQDHEAE